MASRTAPETKKTLVGYGFGVPIVTVVPAAEDPKRTAIGLGIGAAGPAMSPLPSIVVDPAVLEPAARQALGTMPPPVAASEPRPPAELHGELTAERAAILPAPRQRSRTPRTVAAIGAVALVGVGAWLLVRSTERSGSGVAGTATRGAGSSSPAPAVAAPAAVARQGRAVPPPSAAAPAGEAAGASTARVADASASGLASCVLRVESAPGGAAVLVDDRPLGRTPAAMQVKPCAPVSIVVVRDGYEMWSRRVDPRTDEGAVVQASLRRPLVPLEIRSTPPGAMVWVDGEALGVTPLATSVRSAARADVAVTLDGFRTYRQVLRIDPRGRTRVHVPLEPIAEGALPRPSPPAAPSSVSAAPASPPARQPATGR